MSQTIRMLSIDDKTLSTSLERAGYRKMGVQVVVASSYQEAQKLLKEKPIDIIVINLDYSEMDGLLFCQTIKKSHEWHHIPVVVTSVMPVVKLQNKAFSAGADLFIEQPLPRNFFIEKIKSLLAHEIRGDSRVSENFLGKATLTFDQKSFDMQIGDISATGMLICTDKVLIEKQTVEVSFPLPNGAGIVSALGQIVRKVDLNKENDQQFGYGVRFIKFLNDSEYLLNHFVINHNLDDKQLVYYL